VNKEVTQTRQRSIAKTGALATAVAAIRGESKANGTDTLSMAVIDPEIAAVRGGRRNAALTLT
jgi:hypothetical protein